MCLRIAMGWLVYRTARRPFESRIGMGETKTRTAKRKGYIRSLSMSCNTLERKHSLRRLSCCMYVCECVNSRAR